MSFIRLSVSKRRALLAVSISLGGEIMSPYSCYAKKGLVYIAIIDPFSYQLFSYTKCTKLNTYILCNMRSVSFNKYIFFSYIYYYIY